MKIVRISSQGILATGIVKYIDVGPGEGPSSGNHCRRIQWYHFWTLSRVTPYKGSGALGPNLWTPFISLELTELVGSNFTLRYRTRTQTQSRNFCCRRAPNSFFSNFLDFPKSSWAHFGLQVNTDKANSCRRYLDRGRAVRAPPLISVLHVCLWNRLSKKVGIKIEVNVNRANNSR